MRFVITGEWTKNHLLKLIVVFFLLYVLAFWVTNALLFFHKMGFSYDSVVEYYRGSEQRYLQPRSYQGLLEVSHFHLFAMGILMLTLTHLILFVPLEIKTKILFIFSAFTSAILDEASSWLIRYVSPLFAYLKLFSFAALQISILLLVLYVLHSLFTNKPSAYTQSNATRDK